MVLSMKRLDLLMQNLSKGVAKEVERKTGKKVTSIVFSVANVGKLLEGKWGGERPCSVGGL